MNNALMEQIGKHLRERLIRHAGRYGRYMPIVLSEESYSLLQIGLAETWSIVNLHSVIIYKHND